MVDIQNKLSPNPDGGFPASLTRVEYYSQQRRLFFVAGLKSLL